jgi:hypothetical protein
MTHDELNDEAAARLLEYLHAQETAPKPRGLPERNDRNQLTCDQRAGLGEREINVR